MYMERSSEVLSGGGTNGSCMILSIEKLLHALKELHGSKTASCQCPDLSLLAHHLPKIHIEYGILPSSA
jgi:hypothetical protein